MSINRLGLILCAIFALSINCQARGPQSPTTNELNKCSELGGKYEAGGIVGSLGSLECVIPYSDGGRACSDDSECKGGCIFEYGAGGPEPKKGDRAKGICQRTNSEYGCYSHIKNGIVQEDFCFD